MDLDLSSALELIIPAVFLAFGVVGGILWLTGKARPQTLLALFAVMLGLLMFVPGLLHTIAVVGSKLKHHKPYDFRFVSLIATGLILSYVGTLNIGLSRWIRRGRTWAIAMSAVATFFLCVYLILLQPIKDVKLAIILHGCYLCLLSLQGLRSPARPSLVLDPMIQGTSPARRPECEASAFVPAKRSLVSLSAPIGEKLRRAVPSALPRSR